MVSNQKIEIRKIIKKTIVQNEDVYDLSMQKNHNFFANTILVHNCTEAILPDDGNCCLGSINLGMMYDSETNDVNWKLLTKTIRTAIRLLDDVLTMNIYPTPETKIRAESSRRIGLGIMGLHHLLIKLGYKYGSNDSLEFIERLMVTIRNEAFDASIDLAEEKGPFPAFDYEKYSENAFIQKLPSRILNKIKKHGIRNAVILSIAPTGCLNENTSIKTSVGNITFKQLLLRTGISLSTLSTNSWILPFEQIFVDTPDGKKLITKIYYNGIDYMKNIKLSNNTNIEGTYDHKIAVLNNTKEIVWKKISEIQIGDKIAIKKSTCS